MFRKNTQTNSYFINIDIVEPMDYPEISICPFPSYNRSAFTFYGYANSFDYSIGKVNGSIDSFGWNGNTTTEIEAIVSDISLIKSVSQCPFTRVYFKDKKTLKFNIEILEMQLTGSKYPIGKCCHATIPKR